MLMWATLLPHQKKNSKLKPQDVLPFHWDVKGRDKKEVKPVTQADIKESIAFWENQDNKKIQK